eukprot:7382516-Prymnesium_polylepis.1
MPNEVIEGGKLLCDTRGTCVGCMFRRGTARQRRRGRRNAPGLFDRPGGAQWAGCSAAPTAPTCATSRSPRWFPG